MVSGLSKAEREAVAAAVTAAENGTNGEIVTIVAKRSDEYHDVALHYAVLAMLLVPAIGSVAPRLIDAPIALFTDGWTTVPNPAHGFLVVLIAQAILFLLVRLILASMPLRIALTPKATQARRVRRRAVQYFKVGAERRTVARVGVLLYLSLDEHRAEIVADQAIHGKVPPERWGDAMAALIDEVRKGRAGAGKAAAVGRIGAIIAEHFPKTDADVNELPDRLIEL